MNRIWHDSGKSINTELHFSLLTMTKHDLVNRKAKIAYISVLGILVLSAIPVVAATQTSSTYSWSFTCQGSKFATFGGSAEVTWNFTVNGVAENAGSGSAGPCGACQPACTISGSGAVPTNANGITATVTAQVESGKVCTVSTSQPFSKQGTVSIKNLSVQCQGVEEGQSSFIEATFNLSN